MKKNFSLLALLALLAALFTLASSARANTNTPANTNGPLMTSLTFSPAQPGPNDLVTITTVFNDPQGDLLQRVHLGISNCTVDPGEAYGSNFERNLSNYFGGIAYLYSSNIAYGAARDNTGAACTGGYGVIPWNMTAPLSNAPGTATLTNLTRSISGNQTTLTWTLQFNNFPAGAYNVYYMARDATWWQNDTQTADWKRFGSVTVAAATPTPIPNRPPQLVSLAISPNPAQPNSLLTVVGTFSDPEGGNTIERVYVGASDCTSATGAGYYSRFERNFANYFGTMTNILPSPWYASTIDNLDAGCDASGQFGGNAWDYTDPKTNAWNSATFTGWSKSVSGNNLTVNWTIQLANFVPGTYSLYYMVRDIQMIFNNGTDTAIWTRAPGLNFTVQYGNSLETLNNFRALAGLTPVTTHASWVQGNQLHSKYMVKNNVLTHDEDPNNPWATIEGFAAAQSSILLTSNSATLPDGAAITKWMTGPFHAIPILQPKLREVGYGAYREADGGVQMGAGVDVYRGIDTMAQATYPVFYPANGKVLPVGQYSGGETPDPLSPCSGYTVPSGPPIIVQFGDGFTAVNVTAHAFRQGNTNLEHCIYTEATYTNADPQQQAMGRSVLGNQDAVVLIPRSPLITDATYTVQMTVNGQAYTWSFTVGANPGGAINAQIAAPPVPQTITTTQDVPGVLPLPPLAPVDECTQTISQTLAAENRPPLTFTQTQDGGIWTLEGISGRLETWRSNPYKDGPVFDLVQVFYNHDNLRYPLWAAVGVTMPPYYSVYDSASYDYYQEHVGSKQPYYVSFVEGVKTRDELLRLFSQPGAQRVGLSLAGAFVGQEAVDWNACEPKYSDFCNLARFFEGLQIVGPSNDLIQTGSAPASYYYGFLIWPMRVTALAQICQTASAPPNYSSPCPPSASPNLPPVWPKKYIPW